jgi:hypothetical protein
VHREAERRAKHEVEHEREDVGDEYERLEGNGKVPMEPEATFMQVLNNLVVNQQAMT